MRKLWNCPFLILLLVTVAVVSVLGLLTGSNSADGSTIDQSIGVAKAIHAWKEHASGLDEDWSPAMASVTESPAHPVVSVLQADKPAEKKQEKEEAAEAAEKETEEAEEEPVFEVVDDSYFDDALFIGDSRTEGFRLYSNLPNITVYAHKGFQVYTAFDRKLITIGSEKLTVPEALEQNQGQFKKIYMMFGLNEIGWGNDELFSRAYYYLIDAAKAANPDAVVYIQGVIHVTKKETEKQSLYNNEVIDSRNELLKKIAEDENVVYLDLNEIFTDEEGNLQEDFSADGIHLKAQYIELWKEYLKAHAIVR